MQIDSLMISDGPSVYYDVGFRAVLEDHMAQLRISGSTRALNVPPGDAYRYEYDFYGFLRRWGVPTHLHWVTLRLNHFTDPSEFGPETQIVLIPSLEVCERIRQSHMTTRRVT